MTTIVVDDRVRQGSTSSGTGSILLETTTPGFQSFSQAPNITSGCSTYVCITDNTNWEISQCTVTAGSPHWSLSRDVVISSSNAGALVNFTGATLDVFICAPAEFVNLGPSGGAGVFITDIQPTSSGIVSGKTYKSTVPANANLLTATSNTFNIRVFVGAAGGTGNYSPNVTINGIPATLTQSATTRWFTGYSDVTLSGTSATVTAVSSEGTSDVATVTLATQGPSITSVTFGSYPSGQSYLKNGDHISFTGTCDSSAVSVTIDGQTYGSSGGTFSGTLLIGAGNGSTSFSATAVNSFGTIGAVFTCPALTLSSAGPLVLSLSLGSYPGSQTSLKSGDHITFTATTEVSATHLTVYGQTFAVSSGTCYGTLTIGGQNGSYTVASYATNAAAVDGTTYSYSPALNLDQVYPALSLSIAYPAGKTAYGAGDTGILTSTASSYDTITYSSADFSVPSPTTFAGSKTITNTSTGYLTGSVSLSAHKNANNSTTNISANAAIDTVAPTASIAISGNPVELVGSPTGITYTAVLTTSQPIVGAPSLNLTIGTWTGSWTGGPTTWSRDFIISDASTKGTGDFITLSITGASGLIGNTITSGAAYIVGGMSARTITYAAYSRVAALGTSVYNQNNTASTYLGGNTLTLQTNNAVVVNGYYIANSDGTYNPTGSYLGISDSAFASSNTTGTLQLTFVEVA